MGGCRLILLISLLVVFAGEYILNKHLDDAPPEDTTAKSKGPPCINRRGQNGTWVASEGYKYDGLGGEFLPHTKWKWQDNECEIQPIESNAFCTVLHQLKLSRVYFVGDSLTYQMAQSLWKYIIKSTNDADDFNCPYTHCAHTFDCKIPNATFKLVVEYTRNDELSNVTKQVGTWSLPWIGTYALNPAPTLLIANTGMHEANMNDYRRNFDMFINTAQYIGRRNDFVVYRTSVPGHKDCKKENTQPYANASEFHVAVNKSGVLYNWHLVDGFNQYTKARLENFTVNDGWMLLDVYPMTILRPDGHRRPPGDCLHYKVPGPPDYWNHLLYSNLLELTK